MVFFSYSLFAKLAFTSFWGAPHPPQHVGHCFLGLPALSHACPHLSQLHEPQPANRALSNSKAMLLGLCPRVWLLCKTTQAILEDLKDVLPSQREGKNVRVMENVPA